MRESFDVLGIGAVSVDFVGTTRRWPASGEKERMHNFSVQDGGLVGTALVAVAKLGGMACCAGEFGYSEMAERAVQALGKGGVDTSLVLRTPGSEPCVSMILCVEGGQRTIFSTQANVSFPSPDSWPDLDWPQKTKVLLFDHVSGRVGIEAARIAGDQNVAVIIDAERQTDCIDEALACAHHVIVPQGFAALYTGTADMKGMLKGLRQSDLQTVIITSGPEGCSGLVGNDTFHIPAYAVEAIDTTGCGDVFHGAYALMIARGEPIVQSARFASAAAALSARQLGGRSGIPEVEEVCRLMAEYEVR
jgi:sugar/nucleoside kinase (ribokinase family)